jgi:hypothetical protein
MTTTFLQKKHLEDKLDKKLGAKEISTRFREIDEVTGRMTNIMQRMHSPRAFDGPRNNIAEMSKTYQGFRRKGSV